MLFGLLHSFLDPANLCGGQAMGRRKGRGPFRQLGMASFVIGINADVALLQTGPGGWSPGKIKT
jgi:hypothetical protein